MKKGLAILIMVLAAMLAFVSCDDSSYDIFTTRVVTDVDSLKAAVAEDGINTIILGNDIDLTESVYIKKSLAVDMSGKTITVKNIGSDNNAFYLKASTSAYSVTFKNGAIKTDAANASSINNAFSVDNNAVLTFDDVDIDVKAYSCVYLVMKANPSTLNITNGSKLFNSYGYGIGTNASDAANTHANLTIKDSSINVEGTGSVGETGLLVNVPCTVSIENSTISGDCHGVIFRATDTSSEVKVSNSTIKSVSSKAYNYGWVSGNVVPQAALVIGNSSTTDTGYPRGTKVVLDEVTLELGTINNGNHLWVEQASSTHTTEVSGTVKVGDSVTLKHNTDTKGATVSDLKCGGNAIWTN